MIDSKSVVRINNYYSNPRLSNSLLSAMTNPRVFKLKRERPELFENDDKTALRIGSAVDCLLTSPDRWDEEFIVVDVSKPYGLMGTFVQHLPKNLTRISPKEEYLNAYEKSGYKMSVDWVIEKFWNTPDAVEYYK